MSQYLRILSLDGGGYRGVIELYLLQQIMERVQTQLGLSEVPRPCEYFDLIVGTSTGGLIAILLGRLGLSVEEALDAYSDLGEELFGHEAHWKISYLGWGAPRFDPGPLKKWINDPKNVPDRLLIPSDSSGKCRVAVTTVLKNVPSARPIMLRSYKATLGLHPPTKSHSWSIEEAALATSAAPSYFPPLEIGEWTFQDAGAGGFNNPVAAAIAEAGWIEEWSHKSIAAIVSLGTGLDPSVEEAKLGPPVRVLPEAGVDRGAPPHEGERGWPITDVKALVQYLSCIATDSERSHDEQARQWKYAYFRLNPPGLGGYDLSDISARTTDEYIKKTNEYLAKAAVDQQIEQLAKRLAPDWKPTEH